MTPKVRNLLGGLVCVVLAGLASYAGLSAALRYSINETYFGVSRPEDVVAQWLAVLIGMLAFLGAAYCFTQAMRRPRR